MTVFLGNFANCDTVSSLRGELSPKGALYKYRNGCIAIIGTGINFCAAIDGEPFFGEEQEIKELGHNLVPTRSLPERYKQYAGKGTYTFLGSVTKGDHPKDNSGNNFVGDFEDNCSGPNLAKKWLGILKHDGSNENTENILIKIIEKKNTEKILRMIIEKIKMVLEQEKLSVERINTIDDILEIVNGKRFSAEDTERIKPDIITAVMVSITECAKGGNIVARGMIKEAAVEIGYAIAAFMCAYINEPFVEHFVLVSGVSENLGKGVVDSQGRYLFLQTIRQTVSDELAKMGVSAERAELVSSGIVRSDMNYERELIAFSGMQPASPVPPVSSTGDSV